MEKIANRFWICFRSARVRIQPSTLLRKKALVKAWLPNCALRRSKPLPGHSERGMLARYVCVWPEDADVVEIDIKNVDPVVERSPK